MNLRERLYNLAGDRLQAFYSQGKYALGLRPRVNYKRFNEEMYPSPYKACLVISADFELAWGWFMVKSRPPSYAIDKAHQARRNFPILLELFERYQIPVTWATVGHLFLENCSRNNGNLHPEILRLPYFTNEYWSYTKGDWFDSDTASNFVTAPEWYAPDLIQQILDSTVEHEIACHTFSHIDMSNERCPPEVAASELKACCELAKAWGIEPKSFVFPGNLAGNFQSLKKHGFSAYRMEGKYELDYPKKDEYGLWCIPGGINLEKPFSKWKDEYWLGILKRYVDLAIDTGTVCHFWFHPSAEPETFEVILPKILENISDKREILWCTIMNSIARRLDDLVCIET